VTHFRFLPFLLLSVLSACGSDPPIIRAPDGGGASGSGGGGLGGSVSGCTAIGCPTGIDVRFDPPITVPGAYSFVVVIDGMGVAHCGASLPLTGVQRGCSSPEYIVMLSGSALPPDQHSLPGMHLTVTTGTSVTIMVQRSGVEVANTTFSPNFMSSYPNGQRCDISPCITAAAVVPTH